MHSPSFMSYILKRILQSVESKTKIKSMQYLEMNVYTIKAKAIGSYLHLSYDTGIPTTFCDIFQL